MVAAPKRRWFQFSTMLMLLLVAMFAVLAAWRGAVNQRRKSEREWSVKELTYELNRFPAQENPARDAKLRKKIRELER